MALPESWSMIPIRGTYLRVDGAPVVGRIYFQSSQVVNIDSVLVVPWQQFVDLQNGMIPADFALAATDDPDTDPVGWAYTVIEQFDGGRAPYAMVVPHDSTGINLPTVTPVVPPGTLIPGGGISQGFADGRYVKLSAVNGANGVAGLDAAALVGDAQLPVPPVDLTILFENKLA